MKRSRESQDGDTNPHKKTLARSPNKMTHQEPVVGMIEFVSLKNFMCHSRLDFNFGPNINFIIGRNGSGKSAILTAVIVGLGGKAATASRGNSIKNFIKNGKQFCEISIRLRNKGSDAYKHEKYGDKIIVERRISIDGSSSYKLKNEKGVVVSNKKEELSHILDEFDIQVDNPVSILNQETSKTFLQTKSAADKYKLFLKATQLEQMENDYALAREQKKIACHNLEMKEKSLPSLLADVKVWERKWKFHQSLGDLRDKVAALKQELVWSHVIEKENILGKELKNLNAEKNRMPKFEQKLLEAKEKVDNAIKQHNELQDKLKETASKVDELQPQCLEAKNKLATVKPTHHEKQLEMRKVTNEIHSLINEKNYFCKRIEELKNKALQDNSEDRRRTENKIQVLEKESNILSDQLKTKEIYFNHLKSSISQLTDQLYSLRQEEKDNRHLYEQKKRILRNLEGSKNNHLRMFGEHVPELIEKIEAAHQHRKFVKKPLGPVGRYLKLKDSKWSLAFETCLKGLLFAFCCHCHEDAKVLENIIASVIKSGRKPMIIVSPFQEQVYDVSRNAVHTSSNFTSMMEVLDVDNPIIVNFLIDQRGIENISLISTNEIARNTMSNINLIPQNCNEAFTMAGDHIFPAPGYRWYSCRMNKAAILTSNVVDQISEVKEELSVLERKTQDLQSNLKIVTNNHRKNESEYKVTQSQIFKENQQFQQLKVEIAELQSVEETESVDVTALEEELEIMNKQISERNQVKERLENESKEIITELNIAKVSYKKLDDQLQAFLNEKVEPLKNSIATLENELTVARSHCAHYENKRKELIGTIKKLEKEYEKNKAVVDDYIQKAVALTDRISTRRSPQNIESEIHQITKQLQNKEEAYGSHEEVSKSFYEIKSKYEAIEKNVSKLKMWVQQLDKAMQNRQEKYQSFRKLLSIRVNFVFIASLHQANYKGKLEFDHKKQQLHLHVQPISSVKDLQTDMKSLSGGERSFSTVAYILSLWDAMESPFRMLDEFDVFMDMVNRRVSMDMMLTTAHQKLSHQFIFLTPLDMTQLRSKKYIKIFKMPDPDRDQTTLPFESVERNEDE